MSKSHKNDEIYKTVGEGGTAKVHLVICNGCRLARKEINVCDEDLDFYLNEVKILKIMRNQYVLNYYDEEYSKEKQILHIYTEYFEKGSLQKELEKRMKTKEYFEKEVYFLCIKNV